MISPTSLYAGAADLSQTGTASALREATATRASSVIGTARDLRAPAEIIAANLLRSVQGSAAGSESGLGSGRGAGMGSSNSRRLDALPDAAPATPSPRGSLLDLSV